MLWHIKSVLELILIYLNNIIDDIEYNKKPPVKTVVYGFTGVFLKVKELKIMVKIEQGK